MDIKDSIQKTDKGYNDEYQNPQIIYLYIYEYMLINIYIYNYVSRCHATRKCKILFKLNESKFHFRFRLIKSF